MEKTLFNGTVVSMGETPRDLQSSTLIQQLFTKSVNEIFHFGFGESEIRAARIGQIFLKFRFKLDYFLLLSEGTHTPPRMNALFFSR